MTPERWRRITEIVHAALARTPAARAAFLDETCQDGSLRADVDALLAAQEGISVEGTPGSRQPGPHFEPGVSLGPYRIEALVGAGGMGEVYRATDRRLQRTVAIKVLLPGLPAGPGFDLRFEREAQLLASLNHPNIGAIYGLEDLDGIRALVLEFVEGPTLAGRIGAGRLPVRESLAIARQVAFALEAAHEKQIVHRDLKPSNIKITPDGVVKILDFGIAKGADGGPSSGALMSAPTRTGLILGTAGYMSPEQAGGQRVDKRTDIWAFGCVLFEMLTGRSPFDADTTSDVIARILERDPPWQQLPAEVPASIRKLLKRCLQKDADERLHDIADARLEIAEAMALVGSGTTRARSLTPSRRWRWPALAIAAMVAIAFVAYRWTRPGTFGAPVELGVTFPENLVPGAGVAVSPDGRRVATAVVGSKSQIWMHSLETRVTQPVPGTERGSMPFWSPDGKRLAFFQPGTLRTVNLADGTITDVCRVGNAFGGTWTTDNRMIVAQDGQLFVVPASGGALKLLTRMKDGRSASFPQLLPDGRHVLFYSRDLASGWAAVASIDRGEVRHLVASDGAPVFAEPDRLLHVRGASIVAQRFDPVSLALAGEPQVVANGVGPGALGHEGRGTIAVASAGVLAFITERGGRRGQLTWFDRSGRAHASIKQPGNGEFLNPSISPDGNRIAFNRMDPGTGNWDIWIVDAVRGAPWQFTSEPTVDSDAIWSPDGKEVVFTSTVGGQWGLYRQASDGSGSPEPLYIAKGERMLIASDWTRDGRFLVYVQPGTVPSTIWVLPLTSDRKPTQLLTGYTPRVSPDGQWVAYASSETGTLEVYVQRFPTLGSKQRISQGGGAHPRWINEGRELVYWAVPGGVNVVNIIRGAPVGETRSIIQAPISGVIDNRTHYDATQDGRRFLARQATGPPGPGVKVVLNWTARLK